MLVSGVQLSIGAEMEAYGDQAAATSDLFCCKSREEPCRKPCNYKHRVVQLARSDRGHLIFGNYFSSFD